MMVGQWKLQTRVFFIYLDGPGSFILFILILLLILVFIIFIFIHWAYNKTTSGRWHTAPNPRAYKQWTKTVDTKNKYSLN